MAIFRQLRQPLQAEKRQNHVRYRKPKPGKKSNHHPISGKWLQQNHFLIDDFQ